MLSQRLVERLDRVLEIVLLEVRRSDSTESPKIPLSVSTSFPTRFTTKGRKDVLGDQLVVGAHVSSLLDSTLARRDTLVIVTLLKVDSCENNGESKLSVN